MANDLEKFNNWVTANGDNAIGAIAGAVELFKTLRPTASRTMASTRLGSAMFSRVLGNSTKSSP